MGMGPTLGSEQGHDHGTAWLTLLECMFHMLHVRAACYHIGQLGALALKVIISSYCAPDFQIFRFLRT